MPDSDNLSWKRRLATKAAAEPSCHAWAHRRRRTPPFPCLRSPTSWVDRPMWCDFHVRQLSPGTRQIDRDGQVALKRQVRSRFPAALASLGVRAGVCRDPGSFPACCRRRGRCDWWSTVWVLVTSLTHSRAARRSALSRLPADVAETATEGGTSKTRYARHRPRLNVRSVHAGASSRHATSSILQARSHRGGMGPPRAVRSG